MTISENKSASSLLVSVRNEVEAEMAIGGGADLIDVKEPANGSLGMASVETIASILSHHGGRYPFSLAMGEIVHYEKLNKLEILPVSQIRYLKWGLSHCRGLDWQNLLTSIEDKVIPKVVTVSYVDWDLAKAPPVLEVVNFACARSGNVLLLDTFWKEEDKTLLSWMSKTALSEIRQQTWEAGVKLALAGSLGIKEIENLLDLQPDWFAVRGSVCTSGRESTISAPKVQQLVRLLSSAVPALEN